MRFLFSLSVLAVASIATPALADNQRPSTVNNVNASAINGSSVRVTWNKPWDNVGIDGYNVYRNGSYLNTVSNTVFVDHNVSDGQSYRYQITAFDRARNYSSLSSTSVATPGGNSSKAGSSASGDALNPPSTLSHSKEGNGIRVSWDAPSDAITGYNVYRDNSYVTTVHTSSFLDNSVQSGQTYRYQVVSLINDRYSSKSQEHVVTVDGSAGNANASAASSDSVSDMSGDMSGRGGSAVPSNYRMVFNDDFNGSSIDGSRWSSRYRWGPWWTINGESQFYVDTLSEPDFGHNPFSFDGNNLIITASPTPDDLRSRANNKPYLSGVLTTYNKFRMRYGYVEMRARMPRGRGLWPAFWLLHQNDHENRPEIDVVEMLGHQTATTYQTYHHYTGGSLQSTPSYQASGSDYANDFHTYGMRWEPGRIIWYVDGQETNRYENDNVASEDMYLLVNLAVGGWAGQPDGSTSFPASMTIDYIRAWTP